MHLLFYSLILLIAVMHSGVVNGEKIVYLEKGKAAPARELVSSYFARPEKAKDLLDRLRALVNHVLKYIPRTEFELHDAKSEAERRFFKLKMEVKDFFCRMVKCRLGSNCLLKVLDSKGKQEAIIKVETAMQHELKSMSDKIELHNIEQMLSKIENNGQGPFVLSATKIAELAGVFEKFERLVQNDKMEKALARVANQFVQCRCARGFKGARCGKVDPAEKVEDLHHSLREIIAHGMAYKHRTDAEFHDAMNEAEHDFHELKTEITDFFCHFMKCNYGGECALRTFDEIKSKETIFKVEIAMKHKVKSKRDEIELENLEEELRKIEHHGQGPFVLHPAKIAELKQIFQKFEHLIEKDKVEEAVTKMAGQFVRCHCILGFKGPRCGQCPTLFEPHSPHHFF